MEPNKIEKDFRKKLEQRTIQPSETAWDRLDAMLTVAEEKKPRRNFGWLYVAASFLGFALIATVFLSQTKELIDAPNNGVVIENQILHDTTPAVKTPAVNVPEVKQEFPQKDKSEAVAVENKTSNKQEKINQKTYQVIQNKVIPNTINQENQNQVAENSIINQKTKNTNNQISEDQKPSYVNVDELLASVERSSKKELDKKTGIKVNANGLLAQVDGELELSFREKIIKTVNKNYKTVRVALANRNTQE